MVTLPSGSALPVPVLNPMPARGEKREGRQDFAEISPPSPKKPAEIKLAWVALSKIVCS